MKLPAFTRFGLVAHSTLLLASLLGLGAIDFGMQMNHEPMAHAPESQLSCQQRCSSATSSALIQTIQDIEQSRDKKARYAYPIETTDFAFEKVKRATKVPSEDYRLLRPPDLLALYGVLRI